jgi:uncharacterized protein YciI
MSKQHFFVRLIPPRATFPGDMTAEERALMALHAAYTRGLFEAGQVLCYGPVMAGTGAFGAAVFEVETEAQARQILDGDPTVKSGLNTYELWPMHLGGARSSLEASSGQGR